MAKKKMTIRQDGAYRVKSAESRSSSVTPKQSSRTRKATSTDKLISQTLRNRPTT